MIDDSLLTRLKDIGMSEYEAKVYAILSALRVATGREIHEQTKIPRGRVYETLASLSEKEFIVSSGRWPIRYSPVDLSQTFGRLKKESVRSFDELYERLQTLDAEMPHSRIQGYELRTDWTRDNQIRMMLRRAKSEIVLLCNDEEFLARYSNDIARAGKRVVVYLVIGKKELAPVAPVKCYMGGTDIASSLFCHEATESTGYSLKLLVIADRCESLFITKENGSQTGIFICPDIYAGYLSKKIIQEIRPVSRSR